MKKSMDSSNPLSSKENIPVTIGELNTLEAVLRPYIQNRVYDLHIAHWYGAEKELAEDVFSETLLRAIHYAQRAASGTTSPILSFEALCKTIAKRYLLDLRRKDKRLAFSLDTLPYFKELQYIEMSDDPTDSVIEDMLVYSKMLLVSRVVKDFTPKLKEAMLVHLANMADFDDEHPRPLERAMWSVGIPLREYRCEVQSNAVLRSRHSALVCLGYKTLRQTLSCYAQHPDYAA